MSKIRFRLCTHKRDCNFDFKGGRRRKVLTLVSKLVRKVTVLIEKIDRFRDRRTAVGPGREMRVRWERLVGPAATLQPRRYKTAGAMRLFFRQGLYLHTCERLENQGP
ncbi:hypothetical protein Y032_0018g3544 [Ancylostoma ceylanicum]|uniref:Uncharacterized protein n=1 Tax=Ancylostoma ceylanicum TaxID=53326 RepID=A0A016V3G9_9BILA|nr:hypothetical protein Y032_0018g3544 [Ancylostoma ceylanicum]